jgi:hypothetical protein
MNGGGVFFAFREGIRMRKENRNSQNFENVRCDLAKLHHPSPTLVQSHSSTKICINGYI